MHFEWLRINKRDKKRIVMALVIVASILTVILYVTYNHSPPVNVKSPTLLPNPEGLNYTVIFNKYFQVSNGTNNSYAFSFGSYHSIRLEVCSNNTSICTGLISPNKIGYDFISLSFQPLANDMATSFAQVRESYLPSGTWILEYYGIKGVGSVHFIVSGGL